MFFLNVTGKANKIECIKQYMKRVFIEETYNRGMVERYIQFTFSQGSFQIKKIASA